MTVSGLIAGFGGGLLYGFAIYHIPWIYLGLVLCGLLAFVIGKVIALSGRIQHVRSPAFCLIIALVSAFVAEYAQWAAYLCALMKAPLSLFLTSPALVLEVVRDINQTGLWSIFDIHPEGGLLLTVWLLEMGIIVVGAVVFVNGNKTVPYSEIGKCWMTEERLFPLLAGIEDVKATRARLEQGDRSVLHSLVPVADNAERHAFLIWYFCPGDNTAYLTLSNATLSVNDGEIVEKVQEEVVGYLRVPYPEAKAITDRIRSMDTAEKPVEIGASEGVGEPAEGTA